MFRIYRINKAMRAKEFITEQRLDESKGIQILPALAWALEKGVSSIFWVITNPLQAMSVAAVATHPQGAWNLGNITWNLIKDPVATAKILGKQLTSGIWGDKEEAAKDLAKITGGELPIAQLEALAEAAVKYAIPVAGVVALLAGGAALYEYLHKNNAIQPAPVKKPAAAQAQPVPAVAQAQPVKAA
jgi:hypothetical protein